MGKFLGRNQSSTRSATGFSILDEQFIYNLPPWLRSLSHKLSGRQDNLAQNIFVGFCQLSQETCYELIPNRICLPRFSPVRTTTAFVTDVYKGGLIPPSIQFRVIMSIFAKTVSKLWRFLVQFSNQEGPFCLFMPNTSF